MRLLSPALRISSLLDMCVVPPVIPRQADGRTTVQGCCLVENHDLRFHVLLARLAYLSPPKTCWFGFSID